MAEKIEGRAREILEAANICIVASIEKDGVPFTAPVWVDMDGDHVTVNTAEGRHWMENVRRDKRVRLLILNMENPYEYVTIKATLAEDTQEGADDHINAMAKKYLGQDEYPFRQPGEQRVIFKFAPERVHLNAAG
ncbi:MAG: PPOX class F420-dependent oxidoreductase [Thermoleophilaceae bacterium]|nr:PPOX class F420-dependent oxidoreductase [Thermoleophilaceae bacterium]